MTRPLFALERLDSQWEPGGISEQTDGNLRLQPAFLRKSGLAEAVGDVGFEVQRRDIVEHQRGRTQIGMSCTRSRKPLPESPFRIYRQPAVQCWIRRADHTCLIEHPQRIDLAGRLNDPRTHQLTKQLISTGRFIEPQHTVGMAQRVP
jgi:hypothetical protein